MMETITSRQNSLLTKVVRLQNSKKYRKEQGLYVGDGVKLLEEALKWAPEGLRAVILQEGVACPPLPGHVRAVQVSRQLMAQVSQMEAPEGALFLSEIPAAAEGTVCAGALVLDGLQDPGNVGTILRTADALNVPVCLLEGCCDPYGPKTVRATMGAIFRTPPSILTKEQLFTQCREKEIPLLATALSQEARDLRAVDLKKAAVVIGSEGQGVSEEMLKVADGHIIIPMAARCESLNAAAASAIVLWQMTEL